MSNIFNKKDFNTMLVENKEQKQIVELLANLNVTLNDYIAYRKQVDKELFKLSTKEENKGKTKPLMEEKKKQEKPVEEVIKEFLEYCDRNDLQVLPSSPDLNNL